MCLFLLSPAVLAAGEPQASIQNLAGVLLTRQQEKPWQPAKTGDAVAAGTQLVAMPRAEILGKNEAVQVTMLADIGKRGPLSVLESAVTLHAAKDVDLDIALDRGLILLTNVKKAGEAKVRLRVWGETWLLTLHDPQTKIALEVFGRLPPGIPKDLAKLHNPVAEVMGLVPRGQVFLEFNAHGIGLREPPGPAGLSWDSGHKQVNVRRLQKLPDAVVNPLDDSEDKVFKEIAALGDFAKLGRERWLRELVVAKSPVARLLAITWAGAVDDLPLVVAVLETSKNVEMRAHAVLVLRHWLGREPGQVKKLHDRMIEKNMTEVQARSALQLLIGFDEDEKARPETYEMLIHYLRHNKQAFRELAHWHLVRLVPEGKNIPYDAAAPEALRTPAYDRWRALVPEGTGSEKK